MTGKSTRWATLLGTMGLALVAACERNMTQAGTSGPEAQSASTEAPRRIRYGVESGTWMTVDVSPDGERVLFDLIGHIYEVSIQGGAAFALTRGEAWHRAPRYSPDGTSIAMVRDGDGADEVWVMSSQGKALRQITDHSSQRYGWVRGSPSWLPDGRGILFGTDPDGYRRELRGIDLENGRVSALDPHKAGGNRQTGVFSADRRFVYFTEERLNTPEAIESGRPVYITALIALSLPDGQRRDLTDVASGVLEYAPQVSRDGRWLAYVQQDRVGRIALRIRERTAQGEFKAGSDRELLALPDDDDPLRFDYTDTRPGYAFTPDGKHIVMGAGGKIRKVDVATGVEQIIPFKATIDRTVAPRAQAHVKLNDGPVEIREIQWPRLSPDGKQLIFSAVGYLWVQQLPNGTPQRLTAAGTDTYEAMPALSQDGETVAYIAFDRQEERLAPGKLMTVPMGGGPPRVVYAGEHTVLAPSWSPDATQIAFVLDDEENSAFAWIDVNKNEPALQRVLSAPRRQFHIWDRLAYFSGDGQRLLCSRGDVAMPDGLKELVAVPLSGASTRQRASVARDVHGIMPSPDGRHAVVMSSDDDLWLLPLPAEGALPISVDFNDERLQRISSTGARYATWQDERTIVYSFTNKIYRYTLGASHPTLLHTMHLSYPRQQGNGATAFVNARIITLGGSRGAGQVIERGTLVMRARRIEAVGVAEEVKIPQGARRIEASGLTLMPALLDGHYHPDNDYEAKEIALGSWEAVAHGVTTAFIPSQVSWNESILPIAELQASGRAPGPRWSISFHGGGVPNGRLPISMLSSYEDALRQQRHRADLGAPVVKEYLTPRRDHRRWLAQAARELGLGIVAHTQGIEQALSRATDGYTGIEHVPFAVPLYEDVTEYLARTGIVWTPNYTATAFGTDTGVTDRLEFQRAVLRRWPEQARKWSRYYGDRSLLQSTTRQPSRGASSHLNRVAAASKELMAAGVKLAMSAHTPPAVLTHAEMWYLQRAGAPAPDILRTGTLNNAEKIGLAGELGSLEPGKIADLLVLKANPLEDVLNTLAQKYVVMDGIVYEVEKEFRPLMAVP